MTISRLAGAVWLSAASVAAAAAPSAVPAREALDASFTCASPSDWSAERRADGVIFTGAADDGVRPMIAVRYVGPNDKLYATVGAYMKRVTAKPDVAIPGWKTGAVVKTVVAGRAALRVVNDESDFVPPRATNAKEIPVREEQVAVPASRGFYVLIFRAPRAVYAARRPIFARVLASFTPKL